MQNEIALIRADIQKYFDEANKLDVQESYELAPYGLYYYTLTQYLQTDPARNWTVFKIEIWNIERSEKVFSYLADDYNQCAAWIMRDKRYYLLLPEASEGQSVFDVDANALHSFYSSQDRFMWLGVFPSPDGTKIAVDGCYWGCPNELRIFDTTNITKLPYPMIFQEHNFTQANNCTIEHWEDNNTLMVCQHKSEIRKITLG